MQDTSIQGIPCTVDLEYHKGYIGASEGGQKLEPDEPAHYEIVGVYKRGGNGNHLQWLEDKMTDDDRDRIFQQAWED